MNTQTAPKRQMSVLILIMWLFLLIVLSSCTPPTQPSGEPTSFEYQVHVQDANTSADLPNAQVRIEVNGIAPLISVTDANGTARIFISSSIEGQPALLTVELPGYEKYRLNIDLRKEKLPTTIQLEQSPSPRGISTLPPTLTPSEKSPTPDPSTCLWIPYLNGKTSRELTDQNCLNDLMDIGISGESQQISLFASGQPIGTYGICRDISDVDDFELHIEIKDTIVAARFLIAFGPEPIPNQSTYAFRMQSEQQEEMYIKFLEYTSSGFNKELDKTTISPYLRSFNMWSLDFAFHFSGAKASAQVNQMPSPYIWSIDPSNRYLCLAYDAMPTAEQATQLEVYISLP